MSLMQVLKSDACFELQIFMRRRTVVVVIYGSWL